MKIRLLTVLAFILLGCHGSNHTKESATSDVKTAESQQPEKENTAADSVVIDQMVFGRYCKECHARCAPMFRLNTWGNASTLRADFEDNYFKGDSALTFSTDLREKLPLAYEVLEKLPESLRDWKADTYQFGCPDCYDGCGIYIEFSAFQQGNARKRFWIDWQPSEKVPAEITAYAGYVNQKIDELIK